MRVSNPNQHKAFDSISQDANGQDEYGFRQVDGLEEIVHIPSGKSNMEYWVPQVVTRYGDCTHVFRIINIGIREIECQNCQLLTSFHPAVNYKEEDGKAYVLLNRKEYEISI